MERNNKKENVCQLCLSVVSKEHWERSELNFLLDDSDKLSLLRGCDELGIYASPEPLKKWYQAIYTLFCLYFCFFKVVLNYLHEKKL